MKLHPTLDRKPQAPGPVQPLRDGRGTVARIQHLVIVAGGHGTRLSAVVGEIPKALVPIGGEPVLAHQLRLAAASGVASVTILAGHLGAQIALFVGDGSAFGVSASVRIEDSPLGTAGALLHALDALPPDFFLAYGDVMMDVDLEKLGRRHLGMHADVTLLVHPNDHPHDSDLIESDVEGWVTAIHPAPHPPGKVFSNQVNAALYAVRRDALKPLPSLPGRRDLVRDVISPLLERGGRVLAYRSTEFIRDMGTPERLREVENAWTSRRPRGDAAPAVFIDRDGTLNVENGFITSPSGLTLVPGAGRALRILRQAGYRLVVLTNQPVIARGEVSEDGLREIHAGMESELGKEGAYLDGVFFCPHHPDPGFDGERPELKLVCDCRKPATGLVTRACEELGIDAEASWMIGDRTSDIEMAKRSGMRSVLVKSGSGGADGKFDARPDFVADDLLAAAELIASHSIARKP